VKWALVMSSFGSNNVKRETPSVRLGINPTETFFRLNINCVIPFYVVCIMHLTEVRAFPIELLIGNHCVSHPGLTMFSSVKMFWDEWAAIK
jgi:hypothetical protein